MQRTLLGGFKVEVLGGDAWRVSGTDSAVLLHLRAVRPLGGIAPAPDSPPPAGCAAVGIEWPAAADVRLSLHAPAAIASFTAASALLHEPQPHLYEVLPLARFDAAAQRFWRRVFATVRIPGGRMLLRLLARCNRARARG